MVLALHKREAWAILCRFFREKQRKIRGLPQKIVEAFHASPGGMPIVDKGLRRTCGEPFIRQRASGRKNLVDPVIFERNSEPEFEVVFPTECFESRGNAFEKRPIVGEGSKLQRRKG
jgi:hypothetical protein